MQANKTVTINGRLYDAVTGLPIEKKKVVRAEGKPRPAAASAVHSTTQRSTTLHRRAAKKHPIAKRPQPGRHMDISRSSRVARFAAHPAPVAQKAEAPDINPQTHPVAKRAHAKVAARKAAAPKTAKQVKEAAISAALSAPTPKAPKAKRFNWKLSRRAIIVAAVLFVLLVGAFLTYINLPHLSVSFASAQAGITAKYPEYVPDGFRLEQPVTFKDGEVKLTFKSNTSDAGYIISQSRSSWDSSAVLSNIVMKKSGDNYVTTQERGLKIFTYEGDAAWVNGGILYKIDSDAPITDAQLRRIATSL